MSSMASLDGRREHYEFLIMEFRQRRFERERYNREIRPLALTAAQWEILAVEWPMFYMCQPMAFERPRSWLERIMRRQPVTELRYLTVDTKTTSDLSAELRQRMQILVDGLWWDVVIAEPSAFPWLLNGPMPERARMSA